MRLSPWAQREVTVRPAARRCRLEQARIHHEPWANPEAQDSRGVPSFTARQTPGLLTLGRPGDEATLEVVEAEAVECGGLDTSSEGLPRETTQRRLRLPRVVRDPKTYKSSGPKCSGVSLVISPGRPSCDMKLMLVDPAALATVPVEPNVVSEPPSMRST